MILKRFNQEVLDEEAVGMKRRGLGFAVAAGVAIACLLAAGALGSAQAPAAQVTLLWVQQNNQLWPTVLSAVTKGYNKVAPGSSFKDDYVPQQTINQKIQLLPSQNALPMLYNTPAVDAVAQMQKAGQVLDIGKEFQKLGVTQRARSGGGRDPEEDLRRQARGAAARVQHRRRLVQQEDLRRQRHRRPEDLGSARRCGREAEGSGIQPFAASGIQGWPLTRLVGNYIFSTLGAERDADRSSRARRS